MPAPETFCDVLELLNRENVRYVVVSGFAVVMHGHKRDIVDLDVVVDPSPVEGQRCLHALALAGFMPSIPLPLQMVPVMRLFDHLSREVDVFARYYVPFEELWSKSEFVKVGNQMVRIAALEHVVRVKQTLSRPHDLADIEALMRMKNENVDLSLREATPEDESFLLQVYASTRIDELAGLGWSDDQMQAFIRMQFLARERSYPRVDSSIILLDGRPVGRLMVDRNESTILLRDIALLTEYRNAGIGSRLIQDLMKEATAAGKPIELHVVSTSPAVRLYERLGFRTSSAEPEAAYLEMKWVPATS
ncbi:MAG TPA: GNAT family N-acetyltransferase [Pyrinomonadaceae bacterium]|nr:GNAT family N-acetyltransferase [Pyrinomonadaceae bacterium]